MRERVPVRTIVTAIGLLLLTALAVLLVMRLERVLIWGVVAAFFAVVLAPVVGFAQRRLRMRRSLATLLVFLLGFVLLAAIVALLVTPLITQGSHVADRLPGYVNDAQNGRGPVGDLLRRFNVHKYVAEHQDTLKAQLSKVGAGAAGVAKTVANTVAGIVTVFVLAYLMVLEGRKLVAGTLALLPEGRRHRVQRVADDCARSLIGYVTGNVLISIICGTLTWIVLLVTGVPFAGVIAVFVGLVDLLPLVGATIGGAVAVLAGFVHSVTAGIAVLVFFVIYQQLENHLLQPVIMSRTVKLNPLAVFAAVLAGVELAGVLGALLAIPVAAMIQIIARDVYDHRRGRLKPTPTTGEDEVPIAQGGTEQDGTLLQPAASGAHRA